MKLGDGKLEKTQIDQEIDKRLAQLLPLYKRRGYSFDQAFDAAWRRMMREAGMTRVEIARAKFAYCESRCGRQVTKRSSHDARRGPHIR